MAISNNKKQIQPKWPLEIDASVGPYKSVDNVAASLKQNFIFLLLTNPGEWPMNPDLGVGLSRYLFNDINSLQLSDIKSNITSQLAKYLQDIVLIDAQFVATNESQDRNLAYLTVSFAIRNLGIEEQIIIQTNIYEQVLTVVKKFMGGAENAVKVDPGTFAALSRAVSRQNSTGLTSHINGLLN